MLLYLAVPENVVMVLDTMFYVSPIMVVAFLILSKILRLCKWHKTACLVPVLPQVVSLVDYYIVEFPCSAAEMTVYMSLSLILLLLICAYNVFMK